jgi:hypothetical protein
MYIKKAKNEQAPSNNQVWTAKDDKTLKRMAKEGSSTAQIAVELGRTKAAIWGRKYGLGIAGRLTSSKGQGISVPTSVSTKNRSKKVGKSKISTSAKGSVARSTKPESAKMNNSAKINSMEIISLSMIKQFAKESGAKVTITFE